MAALGTKPTEQQWKRELDAMPLSEVVAIATRAHLERRRSPEFWRLIANNARLVGYWQGYEQRLRDRATRLQDMARPTITPEDTLRGAGITSRRQARYQRRMSTLLGRPQLAGREGGA
jgi:hypothetical protein